uniref:C2H2-type domain-containing protein n=2 Tax=Homalodisca liturata TaxID=320908 RepID=A0A1B6JNB4_9HEMI
MPYKCQDCGKTFRYKVSERTHKCTISAQGSSIESPKTVVSNTMQQSETSNFNKEKDAENTIEEHQHQEEGLEEHQAMSGEDHVMSDTYPEPTDFFSFVMSPSDRLQHLSLSGDVTEDTNHNSIDSEALKQLLYDVADYN